MACKRGTIISLCCGTTFLVGGTVLLICLLRHPVGDSFFAHNAVSFTFECDELASGVQMWYEAASGTDCGSFNVSVTNVTDGSSVPCEDTCGGNQLLSNYTPVLRYKCFVAFEKEGPNSTCVPGQYAVASHVALWAVDDFTAGGDTVRGVLWFFGFLFKWVGICALFSCGLVLCVVGAVIECCSRRQTHAHGNTQQALDSQLLHQVPRTGQAMQVQTGHNGV